VRSAFHHVHWFIYESLNLLDPRCTRRLTIVHVSRASSRPQLASRYACDGVWKVDATHDALSATENLASSGEVAVGATFGRFVMHAVLGRGAMGVVIEAYDPDLARRVALKLLRPGDGSDAARHRLQHEAQAMAKLAHPNVVTVFDVGRSADQMFI